MKQVLFFFGVFISLLQSCGGDKKTTPTNVEAETYPATIDSAKIKSTDSLVYLHQDTLWNKSNIVVLAMNERDSLKYIKEDGKVTRISTFFFTDSTTTWLTASYKSDDLVWTRLRQFKIKPVPTSSEAICYISEGKIYHSIERSRQVSEGGQMGEFRLEPFKTNVRNPAQLKAEYEPFLNASTKAIAENGDKQ